MKVQRLNLDNTWRIELGSTAILVDPWLQGTEVDYFPWFNTQWHRTKPVSPSEIEACDLVIVTQKYPDHFHPETLLALKPEKLIIPSSIEKKVKKLLPEAQTLTFNTSPESIFGTGLNVHFFPTERKIDPIYDAVLIENGDESLFLATHGYTITEKYRDKLEKLPPVKLAITPFNKYKLPAILGGEVSPGMESVKALMQSLNPEYVTATHDEDKYARGLVSKFANVTLPPPPDELKKNPDFKNKYLHIQDYEKYTL